VPILHVEPFSHDNALAYSQASFTRLVESSSSYPWSSVRSRARREDVLRVLTRITKRRNRGDVRLVSAISPVFSLIYLVPPLGLQNRWERTSSYFGRFVCNFVNRSRRIKNQTPRLNRASILSFSILIRYSSVGFVRAQGLGWVG